MCSAQTAEPIEMLFVMWTQVAQETVCRLGQWGGGSRSPQGKRQCWGNLPLPVVKYLFFSRPRFEGWLVHPRDGHTMDVLSPLISVLCHSD